MIGEDDDERVRERSAAFEQSHDGRPVHVMTFDARRFFERLAPAIDLAPINTGAARRKPAFRGDWIYVAATRPAEDFRLNRVRRGLKKSAYRSKESVKRSLTPW